MKRNELLSNCMSGYTEDAAEDAYALLSGIFYAPDLMSECKTLVASLDNVTNGERTVDCFRSTFKLLSSELWNRIKGMDDETLCKRSLVLRANNDDSLTDILMQIFETTAKMVDAGKTEAEELTDTRLGLIWRFCDEYVGH